MILKDNLEEWNLIQPVFGLHPGHEMYGYDSVRNFYQ